ncbi:Phage integrase family protein [Roseovarius pacificus]|uniref:Phage integrase family protein n=1 Tax=Roseovarius pacificus TaxID=337701 RepID=A0A1M7EZW4_9RHOB|nr:integrase arm-type DNA-binding domain-containing protein [Roseovarius pacificus]SHL97077.1 Phage integrase family protein [Roseovarius pacificus]
MTNKNSNTPREITDVFVRGFKNNSGKRAEIRDSKITGLVLRITPKNKKTFTLQTRSMAGDKMQITIGSYPAVSLKDARTIAMNHLADIRRGHDPREKVRLTKAQLETESLSLTNLLDEVEPIFALTKSTWRAGSRFGRSKPEARSAIENVFSALLNKPLTKLKSSDFSKAVKHYSPKRPRKGKKTANGTSARALAYLRPVFDWACHRGRFTKEGAGREQRLELPDLSKIYDPSIDDPTLEGVRERVLSQTELAKVMPFLIHPAPAQLRPELAPQADYGPIAFRFILLTLSRREEVAGARCKDFDLQSGTWTKQVKTRRKPGIRGHANRRTVTIPLSDAAISLLNSLPSLTYGRPDDLVFPSSSGGLLCNWDRTQETINRASGTFGWHRHDLRRTAATILQQLGVAPAIIDTLLCHVNPLSREKVSAAAQNYLIDKKLLQNVVDHERVAVNLLASALGSICSEPQIGFSVSCNEASSTPEQTKKRSPWATAE